MVNKEYFIVGDVLDGIINDHCKYIVLWEDGMLNFFNSKQALNDILYRANEEAGKELSFILYAYDGKELKKVGYEDIKDE